MKMNQDSRPLLAVLSLALLVIGGYFFFLTGHIITYITIAFGASFGGLLFFVEKGEVPHTKIQKKRNLLVGVLIFFLTIIILWITFENRFDLETMAKTKSL